MEKVDYLILIVGTNPLPNLIAVKAMAHPDSKIYLIYTKSSLQQIGTEEIKDHLRNILTQQYNIQMVKEFISDKSNPSSIRDTIHNILNEIKEKDKSYGKKIIALNYTGGTKVMSSVSYYEMKKYIQNELKKDQFHFLFAYIDNEVGKLIYEIDGQDKAEDLHSIDAPITINEIVGIHGYQIDEIGESIQKDQMMIYRNIKLTDVNQDKSIFFDWLYIHNYQLTCVKKVNPQFNKKNHIKFEIFMAKDEAEKIGGEKTKICIICNYDKTEELENELSEIPRINLKNTLRVLNSQEDFIEDKIEYFVKEL